MSDLADALRKSGHPEIARLLERKELAGRLRGSGRSDLAEALEAPPAEKPEKPEQTPEQAAGEQLLGHLNASTGRWFNLGASG
jgi:hypothetical protein